MRNLRRALVWGAAAMLLCCCVHEAVSESMTLTTYYPAPSGNYKRLSAQFLSLGVQPYHAANLANGTAAFLPTDPGGLPVGGRLFYNADNDKLYFTSNDPDRLPGDPSGTISGAPWYKQVADVENITLIAAQTESWSPYPYSAPFYPLGSTWKDIDQWLPTEGTLVTCDSDPTACISTPLQHSSGVLTATVHGTFNIRNAFGTDFAMWWMGHVPANGEALAPSFHLDWRYCTTLTGGCNAFTTIASINSVEVSPGEEGGTSCGPFSLSAQVFVPVTNVYVQFRVQGLGDQSTSNALGGRTYGYKYIYLWNSAIGCQTSDAAVWGGGTHGNCYTQRVDAGATIQVTR